MIEAWRHGIPLDKAAIAFGCNVTTMRAHYLALDETAVSDEVLNAVAGRLRPFEKKLTYKEPHRGGLNGGEGDR